MNSVLRCSLIGLVFAVACSGAGAVVRFDELQQDVVARVDDQVFPRTAVDILHRAALSQDKDATLAMTVERLVENRLLARYARAHYAANDLFDDERVAFRHDVSMQNQLVSTLQAAFTPELKKAVAAFPGGRMGAAILRHHQIGESAWDRVFGKAGRTMLEFSLDVAHESLAAGVPVLAYRFPGGEPQQITLKDIYERQNVQGRIRLFGRDKAYLNQQAMQLLGARFVLHWAERSSGLSSADLSCLRQAIEDRAARDQLLAHMGLEADIHDDPVYLKKLAREVSPEEIRAYYEAHRQEFVRIERVRARHIMVSTEEQAVVLRNRLQSGESFSELAREFSQASDAREGGDLGWLHHDDQQLPWLTQLAFLQKPGEVSRPVRLPTLGGVAGWELILVEERIEGYQPLDSESVRYVAAAAIAREKAATHLRDIRKEALESADIRITESLSSAGLRL